MNQEEKFLQRIRSLDPGVTTVLIVKDENGNLVLWVVETTKKAEGLAKAA